MPSFGTSPKCHRGNFPIISARTLQALGDAGKRTLETHDYRISMYQPMAYVAKHKHAVQEQVYHVLEGEGLMEIGDKKQIVRTRDVIFLPPGVEHSICNSGMVDLVFLVMTSPVTDDEKPV